MTDADVENVRKAFTNVLDQLTSHPDMILAAMVLAMDYEGKNYGNLIAELIEKAICEDHHDSTRNLSYLYLLDLIDKSEGSYHKPEKQLRKPGAPHTFRVYFADRIDSIFGEVWKYAIEDVKKGTDDAKKRGKSTMASLLKMAEVWKKGGRFGKNVPFFAKMQLRHILQPQESGLSKDEINSILIESGVNVKELLEQAVQAQPQMPVARSVPAPVSLQAHSAAAASALNVSVRKPTQSIPGSAAVSVSSSSYAEAQAKLIQSMSITLPPSQLQTVPMSMSVPKVYGGGGGSGSGDGATMTKTMLDLLYSKNCEQCSHCGLRFPKNSDKEKGRGSASAVWDYNEHISMHLKQKEYLESLSKTASATVLTHATGPLRRSRQWFGTSDDWIRGGEASSTFQKSLSHYFGGKGRGEGVDGEGDGEEGRGKGKKRRRVQEGPDSDADGSDDDSNGKGKGKRERVVFRENDNSVCEVCKEQLTREDDDLTEEWYYVGDVRRVKMRKIEIEVSKGEEGKEEEAEVVVHSSCYSSAECGKDGVLLMYE